MYREGRPILKSNGKAVKETDHRVMRAIGKKSTFGEQVSHTSWLMYEYTTLERLYQAGAAVPKPFSASENAILMGFCGDEQMAAPALNEVALEPDEAEVLFAEVLRNIELMLQNGIIHGDLSPYNILYWEGSITLIDFPQVTSLQSNTQAYSILERDITRVCDYFAEQGVTCDADELLNNLRQRYVDPQNETLFVDET
jgi:RIO kinase 1